MDEKAAAKYPFGSFEEGERKRLNGEWGEIRRRDGTVIKQCVKKLRGSRSNASRDFDRNKDDIGPRWMAAPFVIEHLLSTKELGKF